MPLVGFATARALGGLADDVAVAILVAVGVWYGKPTCHLVEALMPRTAARATVKLGRSRADGGLRLDSTTDIGTAKARPPKLPPRWFIRTFWRAHRALHRLSGGRFLWTTSSKRGWGAARLTTVGRKSGDKRTVIIGYIEDGPNVVTLAMNGWGEGHPSWWMNLKAHPDAVVQLADHNARSVRARAAAGAERDRLWRCWRAVDRNLDDYAAMRSTQTPVVVLEPRDATAAADRSRVGRA